MAGFDLFGSVFRGAEQYKESVRKDIRFNQESRFRNLLNAIKADEVAMNKYTFGARLTSALNDAAKSTIDLQSGRLDLEFKRKTQGDRLALSELGVEAAELGIDSNKLELEAKRFENSKLAERFELGKARTMAEIEGAKASAMRSRAAAATDSALREFRVAKQQQDAANSILSNAITASAADGADVAQVKLATVRQLVEIGFLREEAEAMFDSAWEKARKTDINRGIFNSARYPGSNLLNSLIGSVGAAVPFNIGGGRYGG